MVICFTRNYAFSLFSLRKDWSLHWPDWLLWKSKLLKEWQNLVSEEKSLLRSRRKSDTKRRITGINTVRLIWTYVHCFLCFLSLLSRKQSNNFTKNFHDWHGQSPFPVLHKFFDNFFAFCKFRVAHCLSVVKQFFLQLWLLVRKLFLENDLEF